MITVAARPRDGVLDVLSVTFGRVLRAHAVSVSPSEVIEIRRVMDIVGAADIDRLRSGLCCVCVKYAYERPGFGRAFDMFFRGSDIGVDNLAQPRPRGAADVLPDDVAWDDDFTGAARMIGADEHTDEVGDLMADDPDARERHGESAHREENDFSVSAGAEQLAVDTDTESVAGGVTYTIEVSEADSASVGELTGEATRVRGTPIGLRDAAAILRALDSYDARRAYGTDDGEGLSDRHRAELVKALNAFIEALGQRLAAQPGDTTHVDDGPDPVRVDQADIDRACHRLVQRMRGAPRRVARRADHGGLDMRRTMRASVATDGVPLELWRRIHWKGPVRLLLLADVSLSVRPVTGFILRLAQTLHRVGGRCEVIAFVDRPVLVTDALRAANADSALTAVLAADGLDLAATSDYGSVWEELLDSYGDLVTKRTSVLVVGDARSNGFSPRAELFAELSRRAHRVAWVTPEPARYWAQTGCGLKEYAPNCAGVVSARDGAELVRRCDELGNALS